MSLSRAVDGFVMTKWFKLIKRIDSLFVRLLLAQIALVILLGIVFGGLFYVERNITIATLYANQWAPALASNSGINTLQAAAPEPLKILRSTSVPDHVYRPWSMAPRFLALKRELGVRGIQVDDILTSLQPTEPVVWLHIIRPGQAAVWLGVQGQLIETYWPSRALLAFSALTGIVVSISWAFTRRLTQPLEALRTRMQTHAPGSTTSVPAKQLQGSPEITAIAVAYDDLMARWQQFERERSVLLAGVSHDLRSPLGRIRLAAELLPDTSENQARKESIVRNVGNADRLIENFLDYVRTGELTLNENVDLAEITRAVAARFEQISHSITVDAPISLPWRQSNALLVDRLLSNLIDNAVKYGRSPVRVALSLINDQRDALLEVTDAGDGIDMQKIDRFQEAFTRGDTARSLPGSGLGLAIVRQIAVRFGASVAFEKTEKGQTVRVTLRSNAKMT